jgi:serine protease Do
MNNRFKIIPVLLLIISLLTSCISKTASSTEQTVDASSITKQAITTTITQKTNLPSSFADIIKKGLGGVVFIEQTYVTTNGQTVEVTGTGIILRSDGYILTNRHVLENAQIIRVTLENLQTYTPTDVFLDDTLDLAALKINADNLTTIPFADPNLISTGDWVIAIGHALGVSPYNGGASATIGIISTLGRSFFIDDTPYYDVIQTDAAINPGNSGGPLININGELVGVNCAANSEGQGIGFAINIATARHVFEDLVTYGVPDHAYLGVSLQDISFVSGSKQLMGTQVTYLEKGGPADNAGIKVNDVITSFNGQPIKFTSDLIRLLWRYDVGDKIPVTITHGVTSATQIILGIRPECGLCQIQSLGSPSPRF